MLRRFRLGWVVMLWCRGCEMAKQEENCLTADQIEVASRLISAVVRDALDQKRKPSLHDVKCRALTAANAYVAGALQINRAVLHAAPDRPVSK